IKASKGSIEASLEIPPEDFTLSFKASQGIEPTQDEIHARDRRRLKEIEQEKRETRKQEEYRLSQLAFTEKLALENKQNLQAKKLEQKEKLMKHISELGSNKLKLLIDLLDRNNTAHQKYDEKPIMALLNDLQLSKETTQGFLITKELDPNDKSNTSAPSTHREHATGKLDANFIKSLREYFSDLGITAESLESAFKTAKISL
ncbi:MAG TPA: hypothetical protein VHA13_05555, partial [Gammaproteobacteria bacterium]|nr:hypothetical protein [Gammaproteobacteria bacterium]